MCPAPGSRRRPHVDGAREGGRMGSCPSENVYRNSYVRSCAGTLRSTLATPGSRQSCVQTCVQASRSRVRSCARLCVRPRADLRVASRGPDSATPTPLRSLRISSLADGGILEVKRNPSSDVAHSLLAPEGVHTPEGFLQPRKGQGRKPWPVFRFASSRAITSSSSQVPYLKMKWRRLRVVADHLFVKSRALGR